MQATEIKSLTHIGTDTHVLVVRPDDERYRQRLDVPFTPVEWDAIYRDEAEDVALFLRKVFCGRTRQHLKELL